MAHSGSCCRTFRYRLHPTKRQTLSLEYQLELQRELYNAALQERICAWKMKRRSISFFDQCKELTDIKHVRPEVVASGITLCRGTLKRLDRAYTAFYRRIECGETPGYPRFKGTSSFDSLEWEDSSGWKVKTQHQRLYLMGIGEIKTNYYRPLSGEPKAITVKREGRKWWLSVRCVNVPASPLERTSCEVGIDLGVVNQIATSEGELIRGQHFGKRTQRNLSAAQRKLATKQRGSHRQRIQVLDVARLHRKIKHQRHNAAHQMSRQLVDHYDFIALEELKITNMVRAPKGRSVPEQPGKFLPNGARAKAGLNRSIHDAGWGQFVSLLSYKAESAGRTVVRVNPQYTSQTCAECHYVDAGNRVSQEEFRCLKCGHCDYADINAARNILRAGRALQS